MRTCTRARRGAPIDVSEFSPAASRIGTRRGGAALVGLPHPAVRRRDRRIDEDLAREVPRAVHAEVHAQPQVVVELEEHLLADGAHGRRGAPVEDARTLGEPALRAGWPRPRARRSCGRTGARCGGRNGPRAWASAGFGVERAVVGGEDVGLTGAARGSGSSVPSSSNAAICAMRRAWRSSPENGVAMNRSMNDAASSNVCWRAPIAITFASLCSRASSAVAMLQTRAARMPRTLFAAICSPLPDPPKTTPSASMPASWSATTACAARMQNAG